MHCPLIRYNPELHTQFPLTSIWFDGQVMGFEVNEHFEPSKAVPAGHRWQTPLIRL
jgi:hypothetical protein